MDTVTRSLCFQELEDALQHGQNATAMRALARLRYSQSMASAVSKKARDLGLNHL